MNNGLIVFRRRLDYWALDHSRNIGINNFDIINFTFIDDDNAISYLELCKKVKSFAHNLCQNGLKKNDKVIICMHDCINFPIVFLGSIWAGIVPICINTMLQKNDLKNQLSFQ